MKKIILSIVFIASSLLAKDISTYLYTNMMPNNIVKSNLKNNGFDLIGEYDAMANPNYHIIVYTSNELKSMASKKNRAFSAVQKVLLDKVANKLVLTNPDYFCRAFMQDDLNTQNLSKINLKLKKAFHYSLKGGDDKLDSDDLSGYHFMFGMPYYEDMIEVATADNLENILEKNAKDKIVFKLELKNATLYGIKQDTVNGEKSYLSAIKQESKSAFLPYMVMIQDNKAYILHAKYYLAVSLPQLSMGEFMTISDAPGNIEDYFGSLFKK